MSSDPFHQFSLSDFGLGLIVSILALAATATYLLVWWLVPREDLPESAVERLSHRYPSAPRWPGIALLGVGLAILLDGLGVWRANVVIAAGLIAVGILLYRRDGAALVGNTTPATRVAGATAASGTATTGGPTTNEPTGAPGGAEMPATVAAVLPPRERSALGWTTLGIALLVVGGAVIWATATDAAPRLVSIPALALLVISAGLLVGAFVGRARWLALPALLLVPVILLASVVRLPLEGRGGDLDLVPQSVADLGGPYRVSVGRISIDLTAFEEQDVEVSLDASTVVGDIWILVPYDAHVVAEGYVGTGSIQFAEEAFDDGLEASLAARSEPRWGDGMTVHLTLEAGIGSVNVYRDYPSRRELRELKAERREAEEEIP